jgi:hypothetical protein
LSDYRAIAAATATLQNLLLDAIREAVPGASVATGPPPAKTEHEHSEGLINVFLYKVEPNAVWRNEELPYRRPDGTLSRRPQLALDLYYLLSFYGDDAKQVPNLLLGAALAALHAEPYPPARYVPQAAAGGDGGLATVAGGADLAGSGLLTQRHSLFFSLLTSEQDEVIQTWTRLLHTSYVLSAAYIGRVVMIEPDLVPEPALPARRTALYLSAGLQPRLDSVDPPSLTSSPGAELRLRGEGLDAKSVRVELGELVAEPTARSDRELRVLLPADLPAGVHLVRVAHGRRRDDGEPRWDVASNPLAFVLQPLVLEAGWQPAPAAEPRAQIPPATGDARQVLFQIRFTPPVTAATDVDLLLNLTPTPSDPLTRRGHLLRTTADPTHPDLLELPAAVAPGRYLVRLRIGGVDSPLEVDDNPASPSYQRFVGPVVEIASGDPP